MPLSPQRASFPWVEKWVNSVWARVGLRGYLGPIQPTASHFRSGSLACAVQRTRCSQWGWEWGELAHMEQEARVALQSGCQALKFPSAHTSN